PGAGPERRSVALGSASAGGALGQVALVPFAQVLRGMSGVSASLWGLAVLMLLVAPLGLLLDRPGAGSAAAAQGPPVPRRQAGLHACRHRGYCLLTLGFFTCRFQLAFIATHLP